MNSEPTIYKPSIYNGNGVYNNGAGGGGGGGVPVDYVELEYIETRSGVGGASFVLFLNDFTNKDRKIEVIFSQEYSIENAQRNFIYIGYNTESPGFEFRNGSRPSGDFYFEFRNNRNSYTVTSMDNIPYSDKCKISVENAIVSLLKADGTELTSTTNYGESIINRLYIMTDRLNNTYNPFYGKLYSLSISGILDLKPVKRLQDGVIGLFDVVNSVFHTAQNGQSFLFAGPIKL